MNIVLLGYMGCGKSLIGRFLAKELQMGYQDLDDYITKKEKKTIPEIFKERGEIYFRKKETECLQEVLNTTNNTIISLGGGTPCFSGNMELILKGVNTYSIYLKTSIIELVRRLFVEKDKRPLISHVKDKNELTEFIGKHLFERSFYYNQAQYIINTDHKTPETIIEEIRNTLIQE